MLNPEMGMEKQEAMKKMEVLSLIEAARSSGLPWDYYLSQMYKRSSTSENSMDDNFINLTDIGAKYLVFFSSRSLKTREKCTLKSLIEEQTGINEQAWKKAAPCLLSY